MTYHLDLADEVLDMNATFNGCPEAYSERCRAAYIARAKNEALERLVKMDIESIEAAYPRLVASGEIERAIETVNKLNALRAVLDTVFEQAAGLTISPDLIGEGVENAKHVLGPKLTQLHSDAEEATPPAFLNEPLLRYESQASMKATDDEREAAEQFRAWQDDFRRFSNQQSGWRSACEAYSDKTVSDVIQYVREGLELLEDYSGLPEQGKRITLLVERANRQYVERYAHVKITRNAIKPWKADSRYEAGECVVFNGHVYVTHQQGFTGGKEPTGAGLDGTILWKPLGPLHAFRTA